MKVSHILNLVAFSILSGTASIAAAETWTWKVTVLDARESRPIEGVVVQVLVTDLKDGNKQSTYQCTTEIKGECKLTADSSGGWLSPASIKNTFSVIKSGYSSSFSIDEQRLSAANYAVLIKMSRSGKDGDSISYPLGAGSVINTQAGIQPVSIVDIFKKGAIGLKERGKFEAEEDYKSRINTTDRYLISSPINTSDSQLCKTTYDHKVRKYSIARCSIFPTGVAAAITKNEGTPLVLSNAYDSRKIARLLENRYAFKNVDGFTWSAEFEQLSAQEAQALDEDLMAAVEVRGVSVSSECQSCAGRDAGDSAISALGSLASLQNRPAPNIQGWRDKAFKTGVVEELWIHQVSAESFSRYFIYRKSDQKVLFEMKVK